VVSLLSGNDRGVGNQWEVDTGVGHQVGLELSKIDVKGTIESEGSGDGGDDLTDETVQVGVGGALDVEVATADIVDSLVINHESTVGVLEGGVSGEDGVVGLDNGGGNLRGRIDGELKFRFFTVIDGETLHKKGSESRSGTSTERVEDKETLETSALIGEFPDSVEDKIDDFLTNGVVTTGIVVGGILFTGDQLFGVEKLTVGTSSDLIDDSRLQIDKNGTGDVFASSGLREKGVERIITSSDSLIGRHLSIGLDTVLEAVELPAGVTDLDSGLSDVD